MTSAMNEQQQVAILHQHAHIILRRMDSIHTYCNKVEQHQLVRLLNHLSLVVFKVRMLSHDVITESLKQKIKTITMYDQMTGRPFTLTASAYDDVDVKEEEEKEEEE
jgi:hypothetical protein